MSRLTFVLLLTFALLPPARALIFYGQDNSFNTSDPGTGVPFDAVGRVETSGGSLLGSAVYLGNGWMVSADHVTRGRSTMRVKFDTGATPAYYDADISTVTQVATGADVSVFRLQTTPAGLSGVTLWDDPLTAYTGTHQLVGWGIGRDPNELLTDTTVSWGTDSTSTKRWGENEIDGAISPLNYSTGSTSYGTVTLVSQLDLDNGEAAATRLDSGSALFRNNSGTWTLMGLAVTVSTNGSSTFGDPSDGVPPFDQNFFAFIGEYEQDIFVAIPEPATLALTGIALLLALAAHRRR
jgi:hypothetical protein